MDEIRQALELELKPRGMVQSTGNAFYAGASRFRFEGDMHATGVSIDLGRSMCATPTRIRPAPRSAEALADPPAALHVRESTVRAEGTMVLVEGRIGLARWG